MVLVTFHISKGNCSLPNMPIYIYCLTSNSFVTHLFCAWIMLCLGMPWNLIMMVVISKNYCSNCYVCLMKILIPTYVADKQPFCTSDFWLSIVLDDHHCSKDAIYQHRYFLHRWRRDLQIAVHPFGAEHHLKTDQYVIHIGSKQLITLSNDCLWNILENNLQNQQKYQLQQLFQ